MDEAHVAAVGGWVTQAGLAGMRETDLLRGFCERLVAAGFPLGRATVVIDTLHPVYEGRVFRWGSEQAELEPVMAYGRTNTAGDAAAGWQRSPFYRLLQSGEAVLRRRITVEAATEFPILEDLRVAGQTDYLALVHRFSADQVIGEMDCVYSSWSTGQPDGWTGPQAALLERLVPSLALAAKCASLAQIAETLVETYLGRDAGRRVLTGRIERGVAERIEAVLWFSDLRGFTRITDTAPGQVIPLLNDYADAIISAIHESGGDVLKLIGDGTLALFRAEQPGAACHAALQAEALARRRLDLVNGRRTANGLPVTETYLGLHIGEVFYGNVGSLERLDFTVIGPAVNEVARIAAMCRSAERDVLMSAAFANAALAQDRARLISVGRYALRGVTKAQELFTVDRSETDLLEQTI